MSTFKVQNNSSKSVSVEVNIDVIQVVDKFCEDRCYFCRTNVINQALRRVFLDNKEDDFFSFLYANKQLKN